VEFFTAVVTDLQHVGAKELRIILGEHAVLDLLLGITGQQQIAPTKDDR
jgi:hypothetical protein